MRKNTYAAMPMVEVVAPDGSKSLWAAAIAYVDAIELVKKEIPPDYTATLSTRPLTLEHRRWLEGLSWGEVRRLEP
jgi:hypothetical protein